MVLQIVGGLQSVVGVKVRRGSYHNPTMGTCKRHRDHVFGHVVAIANACIISFFDNVDRPFLNGYGQAYLWKTARKFGEGRCDQHVSRIRKCIDPEFPECCGAGRLNCMNRAINCVEPVCETFCQRFAKVGRLDCATGPVQ